MPIDRQQYELARARGLVSSLGVGRIKMVSTLRDRTPAPQPKELEEGQFKWGGTSSFTAGNQKQLAPVERTTPTVHYNFDDVFNSSSDQFPYYDEPTGPLERITGNAPELEAVESQNLIDPADFDAVYIDPGPDGIVGTPDDLIIDPGPTVETRNLLKAVGQVDQWVEVWRREKQVRIENPEDPEQYVDVMKLVSIVFKTPDPGADGGQRFVKFNFQKTSDEPIPV